MIEDPGCTDGKSISASPVFGPEFINLRSLVIRMSSTDSVRRAPENSTNSALLCIDSNRFFDSLRSRFVIFLSFSTTLPAYSGCVLIPVPTALPPIPKSFKLSLALSIPLSALSSDAVYPENSWPTRMGTAS